MSEKTKEQLLKALAEQTDMARRWKNRALTGKRRPKRWMSDTIAEMQRQDDKWGAQRDNPIDVPFYDPGKIPSEEHAKWVVDDLAASGLPVAWSTILLEEIAEAFNAPTRDLMREELVQCAAVIGQWLEAIDRAE